LGGKKEVASLNSPCYCKLLLPKCGKKNGREKKELYNTIDITNPNSA